MSKSIMYDLYHVRISPWERKTLFHGKMSLDDCTRFQVLDGLYSQSNDFEQVDAFSYGFRLGMMLMCAVFFGENESQCNE